MREGSLRSTLDYDLQSRVNDLARRYNKRYRGNKINNMAIVVMDVGSGEVLAYVGNVYDPADRSEGTSVDVIPAPRSSGSVLKPLLYAAMLDNGTALPAMLFPDVPTYYRDFTPHNYNRTFDGAVPADRVVERSAQRPFGEDARPSTGRRTSLRWCVPWASGRSTGAPPITGFR